MATKVISWNTGSGNITLTYQGQGNGPITVQSDDNDLGTARSQVITVETVGGAVTQNLTISQAACPVPVGTVLSYQYTGDVQSVTLPPGQYKLQCWGAQGGSGNGYTGGKGGYSEGVITLSQTTTFYIFVGGQGGSSGNGGWNGGGGSSSGYSSYNSGGDNGYSYFGCGGGATDIATVTSDMIYSSYRNNRSAASLLARMIVAGGGSGGSYAYRSYQSTTVKTDIWGNGTLTVNDGPYTEGGQTFYQFATFTTFYTGHRYVLTASGSSLISYYLSDNYGLGSPVTDTGFLTYTSSKWAIVFRTTQKGAAVNWKITDSYETTVTNTDSSYQYGYAGGGTFGLGYSSTYQGKQNAAGSNGAFGLGANQTVTNYRYAGGCGGGGWYGGGNAYADSGISTVKCSGGGSGFVNIAANSSYRPSGYTGLQLDSGETRAGNTSFPNTAGTGNETGHSGNGYAKITRLS